MGSSRVWRLGKARLPLWVELGHWSSDEARDGRPRVHPPLGDELLSLEHRARLLLPWRCLADGDEYLSIADDHHDIVVAELGGAERPVAHLGSGVWGLQFRAHDLDFPYFFL